MTEEVKKILDLLKYCVEKNEYLEVTNMKEWEPLLNYITNLQKENENLLYEINGYLKEKEELKEKINKLEDYKQRNEKAVEYNYKLQEKTSHQALFDEPLASEIYSIAENNINILEGGDE